MTPAQRRDQARLAAHRRWANCDDRTAATAKARKAANDRFEQQIDPDRQLDPAERARRADHARRAHLAAARLARRN